MSETPRRRLGPVVAQVLRTRALSPAMVRVVVGGPGMAPFETPVHADSYVKLVFLPAGPRPLGPDGRLDEGALPGVQPRRRAYTVRAYDEAARELTLDVVVHGDRGLAGPWAAAAKPGDEAIVLGPGGAWTPDPTLDAHLLAGDASALPAIAAGLERLPAGARGHAVIEVDHPDHELPLDTPAGVQVHWVHAGGAAPGRRLVEAVLALPWPDGTVGAFVHGEAGAVRELRRYLRAERAVPRERLSISGYWRFGVDDEGWRAGKRDWLASIEAAEAAAGLA